MAIDIKILKEIDRCFAGKQYDKAIARLESLLKTESDKIAIKLKLADAYFLYGKNEESVALLAEVAEWFARGGFITKALAVQKRVERIDPSYDLDIYRYLEDSMDILGLESDRSDEQTPESEPEIEDDARFIALDHLFKELDRDEFVEITGILSEKIYAPGEVIIREGTHSTNMFIIVSGKVQVTMQHANGPIVLAELGAGTYFGEVGLLTGAQRTATVTALTPANLLVLERKDYLALSKRHPELQKNLKATLEQRAQSAIDAILEKENGDIFK